MRARGAQLVRLVSYGNTSREHVSHRRPNANGAGPQASSMLPILRKALAAASTRTSPLQCGSVRPPAAGRLPVAMAAAAKQRARASAILDGARTCMCAGRLITRPPHANCVSRGESLEQRRHEQSCARPCDAEGEPSRAVHPSACAS